ncbi:MAG TPA: antitoxin Xre/MbcA/ParS toxin-binding domain-containing protein [Chthoniobacteraceae bacterium]|nr:antitoxin Xre/MbcA/ParS toxin-binding domain-containing protein [Chthoniobacteraceae bacterium]
MVASYLKRSDKPSERLPPTAMVVRKIREGLPMEEFEALRSGLDVPAEHLFPMLGLSKATYHRRKQTGRLDPNESDRLIRYARLTGKAVEVLEGFENARRWLAAPQIALGGAVPLEFARTEVGAREVEDLLNRMEYGVYS